MVVTVCGGEESTCDPRWQASITFMYPQCWEGVCAVILCGSEK